MRLIACLFVCLGVSLVTLGCSGGSPLETAPVKGIVTYNGKPLPYGSVSFRPEAGSPATGRIQSDGTFTMSTFGDGDGAVVGLNYVSISATKFDADTPGENNLNPQTPAPKPLIPKKYTSFSTSDLTAEVVQGADNEFTFELKD